MNLIRLFFACDRKYVWSKQSILYFYSLFRTSQMVNKSIFPEEMNVFVIVVLILQVILLQFVGIQNSPIQKCVKSSQILQSLKNTLAERDRIVGHMFCFLFQAVRMFITYFEKLQVLSCVIIRPFLLLPIHGTSNFAHISSKKTKVKNGFLLSVFGDLSCFCQRDLVGNKMSKTFMNSHLY